MIILFLVGNCSLYVAGARWDVRCNGIMEDELYDVRFYESFIFIIFTIKKNTMYLSETRSTFQNNMH